MAPDSTAVRLVYASRATRPTDLPALVAAARTRNAALGITGLLVVANGHYLQLLEGRRAVVEALFDRIRGDRRHHEVSLLWLAEAQPCFNAWSMGLLSRSEPEHITEARVRLLKERVAHDPDVVAADFFRLMVAPSVNPVPAERAPRHARKPVLSVAFTSSTGMWSAAVLQHIAGQSMLPTGRTAVANPETPSDHSFIEYVDVDLPETGPLRAISMTGEPQASLPAALLMERLSLLVFLLVPSDLERFGVHVRTWLALPQIAAASPALKVLTSMTGDRVDAVLGDLRASTGVPLEVDLVRMSDSKAIWKSARAALAAHAARAQTERIPEVSKTTEPRDQGALDGDRLRSASGPLDSLMELDGALRATVLDLRSGNALLSSPASSHADDELRDEVIFLRAKRSLIDRLQLDDHIEDIALTSSSEVKLYRPLEGSPWLFLLLKLRRDGVQLGAARLKMKDVAEAVGRIVR